MNNLRTRIFIGLGILLHLGLFFSAEAFADNLVLSVWNGTRNKPGRVDTLKLFDLSQKDMAPIRQKSNVRGSTTLPGIDPNKNLLLKVEYLGVGYLKFIKPEADKKKVREVKVTVYDKRSYRSIRSANIEFQISHLVLEKTHDGVMVQQSINIINNTSIKKGKIKRDKLGHAVPGSGMVTIEINSGIPLYLPGVEKRSVQSSQTYNFMHEHSRFVSTGKEGYSILGSLKPGTTQFKVSYLVNGDDVKIRFPFAVKKVPVYILPVDSSIKFSMFRGKTKIDTLNYIKKIKEDSKQNYVLYEVSKLSTSQAVAMNITGGTIRSEDEAHSQGKVKAGLPPTGKFLWIFLIALLLLIAVKIYFFDQSNLKANIGLEEIIHQMAELDYMKDQGKIDLNSFRLSYNSLESEAINLLIQNKS